MNATFVTTDSAHLSVEDDMAHLQTTTTIDEVPRLHEATAREAIVSVHLAVGDLHPTTNTMTEAMQGGHHQETMVHHHPEDMMIRMMLEALHLLHGPMIHTLEEIHMLDHVVHLLLEDMAATAQVVVTEVGTMSGHIRYVEACGI